MPDEDVDNLVNTIHASTHGESQAATGAAASNLDLYQATHDYSALGCNDQHYLAARAVKFLPGVPQVYYVGVLAGRNDMELLRRTNNGPTSTATTTPPPKSMKTSNARWSRP